VALSVCIVFSCVWVGFFCVCVLAGVLKQKFNAYLPEPIVEAALLRREPVTVSPASADSVHTVWVGIDPASHGKSDMGLCAIVAGETVAIVGLGSVNASRCQVLELQAVVREFLSKVRKHPFVSDESPLVPIVEANNNEVGTQRLTPPFFRRFCVRGDKNISLCGLLPMK